MVSVALCVLTHNNAAGLYRLVDSIKAFRDLDTTIVVGDNSSDYCEQAFIKAISDTYFQITDEELWNDGFGPAKQRIVSAAPTDTVVIADPDEEWEQIETDGGLAHVELIESGAGVFRTLLGDGGTAVQHGRVFDRKRFRLIGLIHEEVYSKRTRQLWNAVAPHQPFAIISHYPEEASEVYTRRKQELYNQLVWRAAHDRETHRGTNPWWFDVYLPSLIAGGFKPMSFDDWQQLGG